MRSWSTFCKVCMWVVLVICTFFQALVLLGIGQSNSAAVAAGQPDAVYNLWPIAVMTAALWAAVLLFIFLKKAPAVGAGAGAGRGGAHGDCRHGFDEHLYGAHQLHRRGRRPEHRQGGLPASEPAAYPAADAPRLFP